MFKYGWPAISLITFLIALWVCQWCYDLYRHPIDEHLVLVLSLSIYSGSQDWILSGFQLEIQTSPTCHWTSSFPNHKIFLLRNLGLHHLPLQGLWTTPCWWSESKIPRQGVRLLPYK
jgi:hypothetical protein